MFLRFTTIDVLHFYGKQKKKMDRRNTYFNYVPKYKTTSENAEPEKGKNMSLAHASLAVTAGVIARCILIECRKKHGFKNIRVAFQMV